MATHHRTNADAATNRRRPDWDAGGRRTGGAASGGADAERTREVQLALISMGYSLHEAASTHASVDDVTTGVWDAGTAQAVQQFREDNDIEATGPLDAETYEAITRAFGLAVSTRESDGEPLTERDLDSPHPTVPDPDANAVRLGQLEDLDGLQVRDGEDEALLAEDFDDLPPDGISGA